MPVPQHFVTQFIAYLSLRGYVHSTIATALSALAFAHKVRNMTDPTNTIIVRKFLNATKQWSGPSKTRKPITQPLLEQMLDLLPYLNLTLWDITLARAVLITLYVAGLRIGEAVASSGNVQHTLQAKNVFVVRQGSQRVAILLYLPTYKHSQGVAKWIRVEPRPQDRYCPVDLISAYIELRGTAHGSFFLDAAGFVLDSVWVNDLIKQLASALGLPPQHFAPHSLRIGAATDLVNKGATLPQLKKFGRWKTGACFKYMRDDLIVV